MVNFSNWWIISRSTRYWWGELLLPILVSLNFTPVPSVATISLTIVITSVSGSVQNFAMGFIKFKPVFYLAILSLIIAKFGVYLANLAAAHTLLISFSFLLIIIIEKRNKIFSSLPPYLVKKIN